MEERGIPPEVIYAGKERTRLGGVLYRLSAYQGKEVYMHRFSEPMTIGYPEVYLWDGKNVTTICDETVFAILSSFTS